MRGILLTLWVTCCLQGAVGGRIERGAQSSVFADLSVSEMNGVIDYLSKQQSLNLAAPGHHGHVTDSAIFLIEALRPPKNEALGHLDNAKPAPQRAARVVIHRGDLPTPVVEEYRVSPIPNPSQHNLIKNPGWRHPIPFSARSPFSAPETPDIFAFVEREMAQINDILLEISGFSYVNCSDTELCLTAEPGVPPYAKANHHKITFYLVRDVEGLYLHPVGVQFVLNLESMDKNQWFVEQVWMQGQYYKNFDEVREANTLRTLQLIKLTVPHEPFGKSLRSSLNFRGSPRPSAPQRGPRSTMPDGERYSVNDRRISWLGWEFEFGMLASSGIQLHNVKFLNERIAYELSLQEVGVFYSGGSPVPSHTTYYDSVVVLGLMTSELYPGIDCPRHAKFFDFVHYLNGKPHVFTNAACVFEHDRGIPLRRHYERNQEGGYYYAQGMPDNVLILRQVLTVYNYDYVIDFMFHQGGQIEGKVSLTGYLLNTLYTGPEMNKYGTVVNEQSSIANIHHHIVHVKADLDIKGTSNRFETLDIMVEDIEDDLNKGERLRNRYFVHSLKSREKEAAYKYNFDTPKYLVVYNEAEKNAYQNSRGYRILSDGMSKALLPRDYRGFRSRAWAEYQVAVTKHKDSEQCSSSIYATMEPYDPVMSFEDFIGDDENIVDQDLVAWLALGAHHIPHSEDVPIVTTPGVQLTFYLLPYNYFDEDPSLASRDNIRVTPSKDGNVFEYAGVPGDDDAGEGCRIPDRPGPKGSATPLSAPSSVGLLLLVLLYQVWQRS